MFSIEYYSEDVLNDIKSWPKGIQASYVRIANAVTENGPNLGMPYTRFIDTGLFEIRAKGKEGIGRALFCTMVGKKIVVLHAVIKKTQKLPQREIDLAKKRMKEVKAYVDTCKNHA